MANLTITIPDDLARQAESMGLLSEDALVSLIRNAVQHGRTDELFAAADRLAALDLPPLTADEVQTEIAEARADYRARRP
jgi:hypothetical protein